MLVADWETHDCRIHECTPAALLFKERQHERNSGRAEKDYNKLIFELLKDEFP
jgi:hypothetical protein